MKPSMHLRINRDLPALRQCRTFCQAVVGLLVAVFLLLSCVTFAPSIVWVSERAAWATLAMALYFAVIGLRTHVMIRQRVSGRPQKMDGLAPPRITVPFLLVLGALILWPHLS